MVKAANNLLEITNHDSLIQANRGYRFERKFFIANCPRSQVKGIIRIHPSQFSEIYNQRYVNNIYLDSSEMTNYYANVYGSSKRNKIRIRWYGKLFGIIKEPVLELKVKNGQLGDKLSFPLEPFVLDEQLPFEELQRVFRRSRLPSPIMEQLSFMMPSLLNRYSREYYLSMNNQFRVTLDDHLTYYKIYNRDNNFLHSVRAFQDRILEVKYDPEFDDGANDVTSVLPFRMTRSSKYVTGIALLMGVI